MEKKTIVAFAASILLATAAPVFAEEAAPAAAPAEHHEAQAAAHVAADHHAHAAAHAAHAVHKTSAKHAVRHRHANVHHKPSMTDSVSMLNAEMEGLKARIQQLETEAKQAEIVAEAAIPQASGESSLPGGFRIMGTDMSMRLGGYVKTDASYHFVSPTNTVLLDPTEIPLKNTSFHDSRGRWNVTARESRIVFETNTMTAKGDLKTMIETDFFGSDANQNTVSGFGPRLRKAYGQWCGFTIGQTWTTFMDDNSDDHVTTLDFEGGAGNSMNRNVQIRYDHKFDTNLLFSAAFEQPRTDFQQQTNTVGTFGVGGQGANPAQTSSRLPDVIAKLRADMSWGHVAARFVGRFLRVDNGRRGVVGGGTIVDDSTFGFGGGLSGSVKIVEGTELKALVNYGSGIGRYISEAGALGLSAVVSPTDNKLKTSKILGYNIGLEHDWSEQFKSTASYGFVGVSNPSLLRGTVNQPKNWTTITIAPFLWMPTKQAMFGVEYQFARRKVEVAAANSKNAAHQHRVMFSAKYSF